MSFDPIDDQQAKDKRAAALHALTHVEQDMILGLGTGSTVWHFIEALAERIKTENLQLKCVPTSRATGDHAQRLSIPLIDLNDVSQLDLVVDGADEIAPDLSLIKGGGGALLQEKIVASHARQFIIIADSRKSVETLGAFPLPVEIIPFGAQATIRHIHFVLEDLGYRDIDITYRHNNKNDIFISDHKHYIADIKMKTIKNARQMHHLLNAIPGVVETGLFLDMATKAYLGKDENIIEITK